MSIANDNDNDDNNNNRPPLAICNMLLEGALETMKIEN